MAGRLQAFRQARRDAISKLSAFWEMTMQDQADVMGRLERIERLLSQIIEKTAHKEYYSTAEVAEILGRAEFTVREWCRLDRILAEKRRTGRGRSKEWMISHEELNRIQNEGLLPR